jgi:hypothetical protein
VRPARYHPAAREELGAAIRHGEAERPERTCIAPRRGAFKRGAIRSRASFEAVDRPSPEQLARYRAMTPAERLRQSTRLYWSARRLREAHERTLHPDWTNEQISAHVRRIFLRAGT